MKMNMKRCIAIVACCAALSMQPGAWAQAKGKMATPGVAISPAEAFNAVLAQQEEEIVSLADAMPADKYDYVPTGPGEFKGVSSFSSQVKHIAASNYEYFEGWGIPGAVDPKTIHALKTKDDIMKALRDSYKYAHAAINSITVENAFLALPGPAEYKATRASNAAFCLAHSMDHYGQLVEYLRSNGIIPPASRKSGM